MTTTVTPADLSLSQLVTLYNIFADKPVKAFRDKPTALKRVADLAAGRLVVDTGAGYSLVAPEPVVEPQPEPVVEAPTPAAEPAAEPIAISTPASAASTPTKRRGPAPSVTDDMVFATVAPISEARRSSKGANYHRYALYAVGKTVGAYLAEAVALQGNTAGRWRGDVLWDIKHGYITVASPTQAAAAKRLAA